MLNKTYDLQSIESTCWQIIIVIWFNFVLSNEPVIVTSKFVYTSILLLFPFLVLLLATPNCVNWLIDDEITQMMILLWPSILCMKITLIQSETSNHNHYTKFERKDWILHGKQTVLLWDPIRRHSDYSRMKYKFQFWYFSAQRVWRRLGSAKN